MSDIIAYFTSHKAVAVLVSVALFVLLGTAAYQATRNKVTFQVSQPGSTVTINDKSYNLSGNSLSVQLGNQDYQLKAEKAGFETYYQVIHPTKNESIKIPMQVKTSKELTAALPKSLNSGSIAFKVKEPSYLEGGKWAVAEVVQFDVDQSDAPNLYAVFAKTNAGWKLIAGPAPEFLPEDGVEKLMPTSVYDYLEKRL